MGERKRRHAVVLLATLLLAGSIASPIGQEDRWAEAMAAFRQQDVESPPVPGGIVFVGSSSIRLWDLTRWFPGLPTVNRGFGGSHISDTIRHIDRLVLAHRPRLVVLYAGDNDIAAGKSPAEVAADFRRVASLVHRALPKTRIAFIAIKPSIQRWAQVSAMRQANALIRAQCEADDRLAFVDIDGPMIGWDGQPRRELLVDDGLHLSDAGYELWSALLRPLLTDDSSR